MDDTSSGATLDVTGSLASTTQSGGPLTTYSGNGTNSVRLSGSARVDADNLGNSSLFDHSYVFTNLGTIDAMAGQVVRVDYDFSQMFVSTSGGSYHIGFDIELSSGTGGANFLISDSGTDLVSGTLHPNGSFQTSVLPSNLVNQDLTLMLTATFSADGGNFPPFAYTEVVVPQNSIHLSVIPEPGPTLLVAVAAGYVAWRRFKEKLGWRSSKRGHTVV